MHLLHVRDVVRWSDLNEYEGAVHGALDGVPVTCYVLAAPVEQWESYRPGATVEVDAWVERSGSVQTLSPGSIGELTKVDGVVYDVTGQIMQRDGEEVHLESTVPIRVDLDVPDGGELPELRVGDVVRIRGILKVDLAAPESKGGAVS